MVWAIFGLAVVAIGMTATFTGLYVAELNKRHKAQSERLSYELALAGSRSTEEGLQAQAARMGAQMGILRRALKDTEDAFADNGVDSAALRHKLDRVLSEALSDFDQSAGEGGGAVSAPTEAKPADG